ncbi:MAG: hypothetical protein VYD19_08610, partial [Myxococcota bacterium]|nr:hypothetical protein [Myxococcota bacterium]
MSTEELLPQSTVTLVDPTGVEIPAEVFVELDYDGSIYALVTPAQPVVNVIIEREEEELEYLESENFASVEKAINEALDKTFGVKIVSSGDSLNLVGELGEDAYAGEVLELEGDDGEMSEFIVLVEVDLGDVIYIVCYPVAPVIYPVELVEEGFARYLED